MAAVRSALFPTWPSAPPRRIWGHFLSPELSWGRSAAGQGSVGVGGSGEAGDVWWPTAVRLTAPTCSGQPSIAKGKSADENQVSRTSGSVSRRRTTIEGDHEPLNPEHAGVLPHHRQILQQSSVIFNVRWMKPGDNLHSWTGNRLFWQALFIVPKHDLHPGTMSRMVCQTVRWVLFNLRLRLMQRFKLKLKNASSIPEGKSARCRWT